MRKLLLTFAAIAVTGPAFAQQGLMLPSGSAPQSATPKLPDVMTSVGPDGLGAPMSGYGAPVAKPQSASQAPSPTPKPTQISGGASSAPPVAGPSPVAQAVPASPVVAPVLPGVGVPVPAASEAPQTPAPQNGPPSPNDVAFDQVVKQLLPMSPEQVTVYRQRVEETRKASERPLTQTRPTSRSMTLALKPGEKPPTLRLSPGNASVITFSDQTGAQWPVQSVTVGNGTIYNAQQAGEQGKTNMVVVSPLSSAGKSNLIVTLVGYPVPTIFTLETGDGDVDYRLDISVQARGPNAVYDIIGGTSLPPTNDATTQAFLDGVPPRGARKVRTSARDIEAWRYQDVVYVRTPLEVLSPAYIARARNVSGMNVYTLADAPVLIVSQDGRMSSVSVGQ